MHAKALAGEKFYNDEWMAVLKPAYTYDDTCADTRLYAKARAYADASTYAYTDDDLYAIMCADAYMGKQEAVKILADGMVECLSRVPVKLKGFSNVHRQ